MVFTFLWIVTCKKYNVTLMEYFNNKIINRQMRIILITPAPPQSRAGNRTTAARWANILRSLGHRVQIAVQYDGQRADIMIALHAWRSAEAIQKFADYFPEKPLIVAITGTDAYRFINSHAQTTQQSIRLAHQLVGLHDLITNALPVDQRHKMNVIYQSAAPITKRTPMKRYFHVSVLGHLREEKDPLRPALAARHLLPSSRIQIHHYGKAHSLEWANKAREEMATNPRYTWHGELPHYKIRRIYQRTNLLVLPSRMEGGANVISEAIVAGVPVIASDIEGSIGLLGSDYAGYFALENEYQLAERLSKAESDPIFYKGLEKYCLSRQPFFSLENERDSWRKLLKKFS